MFLLFCAQCFERERERREGKAVPLPFVLLGVEKREGERERECKVERGEKNKKKVFFISFTAARVSRALRGPLSLCLP